MSEDTDVDQSGRELKVDVDQLGKELSACLLGEFKVRVASIVASDTLLALEGDQACDAEPGRSCCPLFSTVYCRWPCCWSCVLAEA
jgi:hypothetical protein